MRLYQKVILACFLVIPVKLLAFCDCGRLEVEAEWIYFRPSVNNFIVRERSASDALVSNHAVVKDFDFSSGWRVGLGWQFDECCTTEGLIFRWTQLNTSDDKHLTGPNINTSFFDFTTSGAVRKRFRYHAFEGLYYSNLYNCNCFNLNILAGAQYAWINKTEKLTVLTGLAHQNSRTWGVGPEIGVDLDWNFWSCFSLTGRGTGALLVSRQHASLKETSGGTGISAATDPLWCVIPASDLRFGLRYASCYSCFNFYIEGGYEVLTYNQAMAGSNVGVFVGDYTNADMNGPYIAAGFSF